ncbi:hypothetical protein [Amycolatopsis sp. CA-128772]|uniref:hypothetical protein n=1 Tax=Amycolatopsis sp. CA-128772 TaxID=2073159 RepID=UPI000CD15BB9|nr:hypothetical protein [Amycolatopsis sp. CA-128772]
MSRTEFNRSGWSKLALLAPGLIVALGAAAATAHGLFEVAAASGVPGGIAWIYPLITDGLAIVAYVATSRLGDAGRGYAWAVVILAAGLSGVAQAMFLAGGVASPAGAAGKAAPEVLRFGVGAWPAVAAAIVAHLLFMLATDHRTGSADDTARAAAVSALVVPSDPVRPSGVQSRALHTGGVQPGAVETSETRGLSGRPAEPSDSVQPEPSSDAVAVEAGRQRPVNAPASPKRDRARAAARRHQVQHGELPTVDQLMQLAEVSRGTAGTALQELREQPAPLQLITELKPHQNNS